MFTIRVTINGTVFHLSTKDNMEKGISEIIGLLPLMTTTAKWGKNDVRVDSFYKRYPKTENILSELAHDVWSIRENKTLNNMLNSYNNAVVNLKCDNDDGIIFRTSNILFDLFSEVSNEYWRIDEYMKTIE